MAIYVDDRELLAAHRAGDTEAFDELVREHRGSLYRHAYKRLLCNESAEDAVQETLVRAYRALPNFSGEYRLGPWLHRIMQNVCVDEANRRKKDADKTGRVAALPTTRMDSPSVEDELYLNFDDTELQDAIGDLSGPYRDALVDRFVHEMDYHEVAKKTGVTEQNARARVSRAKSVMRAALKGVAVLPLLLIGLLKRGEKVAAAATSTGGATVAVAGTTTVSATAQLASVGAPSLVEAANFAAHAAPMALPVIAKAAVGIGLVAAVFTPGADSAMHQAVENITSDVVVSDVIVDDVLLESTSETPVIVIDMADTGNQLGQSDNSVFVSSDNIERLDDGTISEDSAVIVQDKSAAELFLDDMALVDNAVVVRIDALAASITNTGPGFFDLEGEMLVTTQDSIYVTQFNSASQIRLFLETDVEGRMRIEGLLVGQITDGEMIEFRLAGFARENSGSYQIAGLYRADSGMVKIERQGSFTGSFEIGSSLEPGSLAIKLVS
jgi:RNA polymerase sigma-70 factor (ECF subfamily)